MRPPSVSPPTERQQSPYPTSHSPYPTSHSPYHTSHSPYPTSHSPYSSTSNPTYSFSHSPQKTYTSLDTPRQQSPPLKEEFKSEYPSQSSQSSHPSLASHQYPVYSQFPAISQYHNPYPPPYHPYQGMAVQPYGGPTPFPAAPHHPATPGAQVPPLQAGSL